MERSVVAAGAVLAGVPIAVEPIRMDPDEAADRISAALAANPDWVAEVQDSELLPSDHPESCTIEDLRAALL